VFVLLLCFICSSITYAHLLGFYFKNEFFAFVGLVGLKLFLGLITTSAGMVVEAIKDLNSATKIAHKVLSKTLPLVIPHYSFGKGLYDIGQNKLNGQRLRYDATTMTLVSVGKKNWWDVDVIGDDIGFLCGTCVFYGILILLVEVYEGKVGVVSSILGSLDIGGLFSSKAQKELAARKRQQEDEEALLNEDEDVAAERVRVEEMATKSTALGLSQIIHDCLIHITKY